MTSPDRALPVRPTGAPDRRGGPADPLVDAVRG